MTLTIVMYHYVRDLDRSRWPRIKGRRTSEFRAQLDYLAQHYAPVTAAQIIAASRGEDDLPPNAVWLTFDDGYLDHYATVFPLLHERGWQGAFFAPARAITEGKLLDVNKIHLALASTDNPRHLVEFIRGEMGEPSFERAWRIHAVASEYDPAEVMFVKNALQHGLRDPERSRILDAMFARFVSSDEAAIAGEVYMTLAQLQLMVRSGMVLGSHGHDHLWMDRLAPEHQAREIERSLAFLTTAGVDLKDWIMCYPYGAHNSSLINELELRGCAIGLTTKHGVADLRRDQPLTLPRIDTNELPH